MTRAVSQIDTHGDTKVEPMLSPKQIGEQLGCSLNLVLDYIHRGELPAICISANPRARKRRYRVSPADLQRFIQARSVQQPVKRHRRRREPYVRYV
jgi:hypothetical protein